MEKLPVMKQGPGKPNLEPIEYNKEPNQLESGGKENETQEHTNGTNDRESKTDSSSS